MNDQPTLSLLYTCTCSFYSSVDYASLILYITHALEFYTDIVLTETAFGTYVWVFFLGEEKGVLRFVKRNFVHVRRFHHRQAVYIVYVAVNVYSTCIYIYRTFSKPKKQTKACRYPPPPPFSFSGYLKRVSRL